MTTTAAGRLDTADLSLPDHPRVSIVIPTLNDAEHIATLLDSLDDQTYGAGDLEVLVADAGSSDRTRDLVRQFPSRFHALTVLSTPRRRKASRLNAGMQAATGDCCIVVDPRCELDSDFVEQCLIAMRRTGAACVGGPVELISEDSTGRAIAAAMSSPFTVPDTRFVDSDEETAVASVPFGCYHAKVWEAVGEYDESALGTTEEYNARVIDAGGSIVYVPEIRSRYHDSKTIRELASSYWLRGNVRGSLLGRGGGFDYRDLIPSAIVVGLPPLFLLSRRNKLTRWAFRSLAGLYVSRAFRTASDAAEDNDSNPVLTFVASVTMTLTFGAGFIRGVLRGRLGR